MYKLLIIPTDLEGQKREALISPEKSKSRCYAIDVDDLQLKKGSILLHAFAMCVCSDEQEIEGK